MNLNKKKLLAARSLNVGRGRIIFHKERLNEIKEAITKQDIKDLKEAGAILINEEKGRKKILKRRTRRRAGSIRKKKNETKKNYIILTRKLRSYLADLKRKSQISSESFLALRKEIRSKSFRSLAHMKEKLLQIKEAK